MRIFKLFVAKNFRKLWCVRSDKAVGQVCKDVFYGQPHALCNFTFNVSDIIISVASYAYCAENSSKKHWPCIQQSFKDGTLHKNGFQKFTQLSVQLRKYKIRSIQAKKWHRRQRIEIHLLETSDSD